MRCNTDNYELTLQNEWRNLSEQYSKKIKSPGISWALVSTFLLGRKSRRMYISASKQASKKYPIYFDTCSVSNWADIARVIVRSVWSPITWAEGRRHGDNFLSCELCVLDVDDGMSLESAVSFVKAQGYSHLIATTKSHQVAKGDEPACDRFRVILRFSQVISDPELYRFNIRRVAKAWGADRAATDLARTYQPSREIVSMSSGGVVPLAPVKQVDPRVLYSLEKHRAFLAKVRGGQPKSFALEFIERGRLDHTGGRKRTIYSVACELVKAGWLLSDIETAIRRSPIDWSGIDSRTVKAAVDSAARRFSNG